MARRKKWKKIACCAYCDLKLYGKRSHARYCSSACKQAGYRERCNRRARLILRYGYGPDPGHNRNDQAEGGLIDGP
jgi:hypothetical protein